MLKTIVTRLLVAVMLTLSAVTFDAHAQNIQVKEKLPGGEYIITVDGIEHRTLTAAHARAILESNEELDSCQRARAVVDKQLNLYETSLELLKRDRDLANTQAQLERERAIRFQTMLTGERALRVQAESLYRPPGKITRFFENPYVQIATKIGVPLAQSFIAARRE